MANAAESAWPRCENGGIAPALATQENTIGSLTHLLGIVRRKVKAAGGAQTRRIRCANVKGGARHGYPGVTTQRALPHSILRIRRKSRN